MSEFNRSSELSHILKLQEEAHDGRADLKADMWDRRVKNWKQNFWNQNLKKGKAMDRIMETADYLRVNGVLGPNTDVVDIGCGPGRFVSEFASTARRVVGIDISTRTIEYAQLFTREQGRDNTRFLVRDFCSMDLEAEGLYHAFDLAFCSLSPAVSGLEGLEKFMELSRSWCCMNAIVSGRHQLHERIAREVFHRDTLNSWNGRHFYTSFNTLFLTGYLPVTSYYTQTKENYRTADREFAEISGSIILPPGERTTDRIEKIYRWMAEHADEDGNLYESSEFTYGRLLWNLKGKRTQTRRSVENSH